jgi:CheY-like chemotaxis protein
MLGNEYQIQEASDGETALRLLMEYSFSLILLDISLPGMSGPEVLKKMKSSDELMNIPVVALTARAMKGDREEFLAMGFDEYLAKPMDEAEFTRVINIYINKE